MAQRQSFRMSADYGMGGFTQEQLSMLQEKDQTISDLQFALDERTAELEDVRCIMQWNARLCNSFVRAFCCYVCTCTCMTNNSFARALLFHCTCIESFVCS